MSYNPTTWQDLPTRTTPINAAALNKLEQAVAGLSLDVEDLNSLGSGIRETTKFNNATDPKKIYVVSLNGGGKYLVLVVRSSTAITQWRFSLNDLANAQVANIHLRHGTVSLAGAQEVIDWGNGQWESLKDNLDLCTEGVADSKIAAAVSGKADAATTLSGYGITDAVPSSRMVGGISLSSDILASTLRDNLALGYIDNTVASGKGVFGTTVNGAPMFNANGSASGWTALAKASDIPDISGKVDKTQKVAGEELSGDIDAATLYNNMASVINPYNVNVNTTRGYKGQVGVTSDGKPVFHPSDFSVGGWEELAKASDIPNISGKLDKQTSIPSVATTTSQGQTVPDTSASAFQNLAITQIFQCEIADVDHIYMKITSSSYIEIGDMATKSYVDTMLGNIESALASV